MLKKEPIMRIAGVDLAWQSQKKSSGYSAIQNHTTPY